MIALTRESDPMRVLLVEDSQRLQRSLGTGLRRAGHAVDIAGTGTDGLWRATSIDYDVIVLDIMLPGIDNVTSLHIANTCTNLSPADIPRLFEPFWRKDSSRTDSHHSGLGLALALALVHAYCQSMGISMNAALMMPEQFELSLSFGPDKSAPVFNQQ